MGACTNPRPAPRKCVACGGTGVSTKGFKCIPCYGSGRMLLFKCDKCTTYTNGSPTCKSCGGRMRMV